WKNSYECDELSSLQDINSVLGLPTMNLHDLSITNRETKLTIGAVNTSLNMPRLWFLNLSGVSHLELLSEGFSNLPELFDINISGLGLEQLLDSQFPIASRLSAINARHNKLSFLSKDLFKKLSRLYDAFFAHNALSHLELPHMPNLTKLDLGHNKLTDFNLYNCPRLEHLYLNNNQLTQVSIFDHLPMVHMCKLYLTGNKLQHLHPRTFKKLPFLDTLLLANNALRVLPAGLFAPIQNLTVLRLKKLDLSNNCISELIENQFELLGELEILELSGNRITTLNSAHFAGLTSLCHLHLASNYNMELIGHTFEALEQLQTLDLSYIFLENLSPHLFGFKKVNKKGRYKYLPMVHMRKLSLTGNMLQHLHPRTFEKLPFLDTLLLADNTLRVIPAGLFAPIRNLRMLDVGQNQLMKISRDLLEALSKITVLQIDYNQLSSLPDLNGTLPNLVRMDVEGNPWQCDLFAQTERWLISRKIAYI
ncbi:hypothetical protein KR215_011008, partial [Drosophila sulfurigaster]